ncbi:hypothetical protein JQ543_12320 [Bradyrhizobium diazoefficiens]|nr:hypothetical protein [Bradyrhizobium diazoefficiens]MBR0848528.1 hypothetical protein [Bradyrhizobium diazoefficiens]
MNHSIYTADQATHLKIVISALLASIAIMAATLTDRLARPAASEQMKTIHTAYKPCPGQAVTEMIRPEQI